MTNLAVVFFTGLTTGGLSCLAVQGGLLASSVADEAQQDIAETGGTGSASGKRIASPIFWFLAAKIIAYTLLGFLLGAAGSVLQLTPHMRAIVQIAIGIFMVGTALRLLKAHPIFRYFAIEPPKKVTRYIRRISKHSDGRFITPVFLGALTVLIPCGVTVAMMALAIGSGSPVAGALIMAAFTLGTTPVFFSLAYFATKLGERLQGNFSKAAGAVILVLGLIAIDGGLVLAGSTVSFTAFRQSLQTAETVAPAPLASAAPAADGTALALTATSYGYSPAVIQAKADQPYKLIITSEDNRSCGRSFVIPAMNFQKTLPQDGQVTIDIPAQKAGTLKMTCVMGMYNAEIAFN